MMLKPIGFLRKEAAGGGGTPPTYNAATIDGGSAVGAIGGFTVNWPTHATDDYFVVLIGPRGSETGLVTPDTGTWSTLAGASSGTANGDRALEIYYRRAGSASESDTAWSDAGSQRHTVTAFTVSGVDPTGTKISQFTADSNGGSTAFNMPGGTTPSDNVLVVGVVVGENTTGTTSESNGDITSLTEILDALYSDRSVVVYTGTVGTAAVIGATTATAGTSGDWAGCNIIFESE